ncbi:pyrimidine/purine nucleoside phosphorylase [Paenibacillus anaericanus]|uniref:Pyrimidine/purine nucleoside phosphorylase n=1 Tax=Paenibacillus anaericanus TaxID=170367 RepID=A0A433XXK9_9BACL|nr:pyrimidine/purine nucleoside phosphorylase [Paenibacillus anaericanus]RUT39613.1 pyrimidine/purine nucleoside phosphorylase [Paenibacillus anaericanus]
MTQLSNVTVEKAANIYFDGKVTSRSVWLQDGNKITLGIMLPGEYEFGTDTVEVMEILSGDLKVLLPEQTEWIEISGQGTFTVPAHTSFKLEVRSVTDYCCSYSTEI